MHRNNPLAVIDTAHFYISHIKLVAAHLFQKSPHSPVTAWHSVALDCSQQLPFWLTLPAITIRGACGRSGLTMKSPKEALLAEWYPPRRWVSVRWPPGHPQGNTNAGARRKPLAWAQCQRRSTMHRRPGALTADLKQAAAPSLSASSSKGPPAATAMAREAPGRSCFIAKAEMSERRRWPALSHPMEIHGELNP